MLCKQTCWGWVVCVLLAATHGLCSWVWLDPNWVLPGGALCDSLSVYKIRHTQTLHNTEPC